MEEINKLNQKCFLIELDIVMKSWTFNDISEILKIDKTTLEYLIERTGKQALKYGVKNSFNKNFIEEDNYIITSVGMYQLVKFNSDLKKHHYLLDYIPFFSQEAMIDLMKLHGRKKNNKRKGNSNSTYDFELQGEYDLKKYDKSLKTPDLEIENKSHLFYGKRIVITGTFPSFESRTEMAQKIKDVGGDNNTSISKKTDYVVIGENAGPSKLKKIEELNISTLNESEFLSLFNV